MALRPSLTVLLTLALVLGAGCASDDATPTTSASTSAGTTQSGTATTTTGTTTAATSTASNSPTPRPAQTFEVAIQGNAFVNATVTIQEGDTVRWVHKDGTTPHSVKSDNASFDSNGGLPCPGPGCMTSLAHSTYDRKFDQAGTWPYHCEVHPSMKGNVVVEVA